jgi:hypothetical protein
MVACLPGTRPGWLIAERRQAQIAREAEDKLRRELADALVASVQELKHAVTDAPTRSTRGGRLRPGGRYGKHGSWPASWLQGGCGRGSAGNGTPPSRRPATGPASSSGGHWGDDGGQVRDS